MRAMTIAVLLVLALMGASCGGGDDTASDTDTVVTDTTDTTDTEGITAEATTTEDTIDPGTFATGACAQLVAAATSFSRAFSGSVEGDADETSELFEQYAESAPDEIKDDLRVLAEAYDEYLEVLADVNIEPGETPDAEAIASLTAALASVDQEGVAEASANVSAWTTENC